MPKTLIDDVMSNPSPAPMPPATPTPTAKPSTLSADILTRLDEMNLHLKRMDRRDRVRMIGSSIHSLITLGFLVFTIWSSIYLFEHFGDIIKMVTDSTAQSAMDSGKANSANLLKQVQDMINKK